LFSSSPCHYTGLVPGRRVAEPSATVESARDGVQIGYLKEEASVSATILWIIAAILVIVGIVQLIQGQIILGIVLIVLGCLVGPGGYSLFRARRA
jgi:hypothetical protein